MKVSELIKNLENFKEEYGDLECWYASDPEGNSHFPLEYTPSKAYIIENDEISYGHPGGQKICVIN